MGNRQSLAVLAGCAAIVTVSSAVPTAPSPITLIAPHVAVFVVVCVGVARADSSDRVGWWSLAISCGIGLVASITIGWLPTHLSDAAWTLTIGLRQLTFLFGLGAILARRRGVHAGRHLLDAGIIAVGVTVCAWILVIEPRFGAYPPQPGQKVVGLTFALLDFLLLWSLARIVTGAAHRTPTLLLLAAGGTGVLVTDLLANTQLGRHGFLEFQPGGSVYLAWQVCGVLIAAAALRAPSDHLREPAVDALDRTSRWRFALLVSVALLTPAIPVVVLWSSGDVIPERTFVPLIGLFVLTCVLLLLLVIRLADVTRVEVRRAEAMNQQTAVMARQAQRLQRTLDTQHELQGELAWRATHDPLTRLGNRAMLAERLVQILDGGRRSAQGALLLLDLDAFKEVNDTLGHPAGDDVLIQVAHRLASTAGGSENVARIGGDEFAVVVEGGDALACRVSARVIGKRLRESYVFGDRRHQLTASIGLVLLEPESHDAPGALRDADLALYSAKRAGGNQICEFTLDMRDAHERYVELAAGVRTAISERSLHLVYQPIVEMTSRRTVAVEALVRWRAASGRAFSPEEFIAVAEDIGLVSAIGNEVLNTAAGQASGWNAQHSISLSVNVSGRELMSSTFADDALHSLERHSLSPAALILEITETVLIHASGATGAQAMRNLNELRRHGVRIAVDDFGTGYSSLAYLQRLPIDILKVDRMFTTALDDPGERNVHFVGAILALGASLGLPVVAEGVESCRQATLLSDLGCPLAQGFYFARPCPAEQVVDYFPGVTTPTPTSSPVT